MDKIESDNIDKLLNEMEKIFEFNSKGWVNLTKILQSTGQRMGNFGPKRDKFLKDYVLENGGKVSDYITIGTSRKKHTYVCQDVAIGLAGQVHNRFQIRVACIIKNYLHGELTTEGSKAAEQRYNKVFPTAAEEEKAIHTISVLESLGKLTMKSKEWKNTEDILKKCAEVGDYELDGKLHGILSPSAKKMNDLMPKTNKNQSDWSVLMAYADYHGKITPEQRADYEDSDRRYQNYVRNEARDLARRKGIKTYVYDRDVFSVKSNKLKKKYCPPQMDTTISPELDAFFANEKREEKGKRC